MLRGSGFSVPTLLVLPALSARPADWRHGYDLAKQTGLKSGTLYPILVRLADWGLVEPRWEEHQAGGRPPRHLYRLISESLERARAALAGVPTTLPAPPAAAPQRVPRGLAGEGL